MKKMFIALSLLTLVFSQAQARSMQRFMDIKLFGVNQESLLTGQVVVGQIDIINRVLKFELFDDRCNNLIPSDSLVRCMAMPSLTLAFEGPYTSENPGICGGLKISSFQQSTTIERYSVNVSFETQGQQCGLDPRNQSMTMNLINSKGVRSTLNFVSRPQALLKYLAQ